MNIYKHTLNIGVTEIPCCAKLLHVDEQYNKLCAWFIHKEDARPRKLGVYCTGDELGEYLFDKHIDTVLVDGGATVYHIFDVS